jgi:hypothetical protein
MIWIDELISATAANNQRLRRSAPLVRLKP